MGRYTQKWPLIPIAKFERPADALRRRLEDEDRQVAALGVLLRRRRLGAGRPVAAAPGELLGLVAGRGRRLAGHRPLAAPGAALRQHLARGVQHDAAEVLLRLAAAGREPGDVRVEDLLVGLGENVVTFLVLQV